MVRKEGKGRYGQEGKYQSDRTNPLQEETKWECTKCELPPCHQKHGILEVPEDICKQDIVPIAVSSNYFCERHVSDHNLKIEKSRKEELEERDICSPGKEKILTGKCQHWKANSKLEEEEMEERSIGCEERTGEEHRLGEEDKVG
ncbi:hypothetical protein Tsp_02747 [Trichinella spiralis]|uniref:hypothetical protein n=1 Tax=Trichinella spiralis TaxID=6334 RepID=UPI0001EFC373|nr:hypothetical protein Tsp_02747 [Trichinella spiralis]